MKLHKYLVMVLCSCLMFNACSRTEKKLESKLEVTSYSEQVIKLERQHPIFFTCDYADIEVYTWDKNEIKYEITKKIRGNQSREILEKKLKNYSITAGNEKDRSFFKAKYKGTIHNPEDQEIKLRVYIPKKARIMECKLDNGSICFYDDIKGELLLETGRANIEVHRLLGRVYVKGKQSNIKILNGKIEGDSSIVLDSGNINLRTEFLEAGVCKLVTNLGNIHVKADSSSRVTFNCQGTLKRNEFSKAAYPTIVQVISKIGEIEIQKF